MKRFSSALLLLALGTTRSVAQWAVIDVANFQQSAMNYATLVEQLGKQATQISNQVQQIKQFETQLDRMGDMATFKNLIGFSQFRSDLNLPSKVQTWAEGISRANGSGLFGDTRGGLVTGITPSFKDFDGVEVERDSALYKDAHDTIVTVDEFKEVQNDVYSRRAELKKAIGSTSDALQAAKTEAEEKKLAAVLGAQYGQLASIDSDIVLSAAQVQVKASETSAITTAQTEAEAESRRQLAQRESEKLSATYTPIYECLLQYVTETQLEL